MADFEGFTAQGTEEKLMRQNTLNPEIIQQTGNSQLRVTQAVR